MDHIVYLDHQARELENLKAGKKTMIIRGAMGRKVPYGRVNPSDVLYFAENNGKGFILGQAKVKEAVHTDKLTREESICLVDSHQEQLLLNAALRKRFAGKRYLVLITLQDFTETEAFAFDRSDYGNMDDWLPVGDIGKVRKE